MKNEDQLTRLVRRFAVTAKAHHEALEVMDDVLANRHAAMIAALYAAIADEGDAGKERLLTLLDDPEDSVAGMAAVYLLRYNRLRCVAVLREIAAGQGLLAFRARVALERWEKGELK